MKKIFFLVLLILVFYFIYAKFYPAKNTYNFSLKSEFSPKTSLKDFKGKKLIIYFGFTFCPDVCPATLNLIAQELNKIKSNEAFLIFISLDPKRDNNLSKTNEWLRYFYPNSTTLLAENENDLKKITKNYGVIYEKIDLKDSFMAYTIAHSNQIYLIDEKGNFYKALNDLNPQELYKELKFFLNIKSKKIS